jgi:cytochrome c553
MSLKRGVPVVALLTLAAVAPPGAAQSVDYQARSWAASCAACHGFEGRSQNEIPALAGRSKADLVAALKEFRSDQRKTATVMHQHAKGYSDAQLERIADFFSQEKR